MSTRPARPKATKLYPSQSKTKTGIAETENGDSEISKLHKADVIIDQTSVGYKPKASAGEKVNERSETTNKGTKAHNDTNIKNSSETSKAVDVDKEKPEFPTKTANLSKRSKGNVDTFRSEKRKISGRQGGINDNNTNNHSNKSNATLTEEQAEFYEKHGVLEEQKNPRNTEQKPGATTSLSNNIRDSTTETQPRPLAKQNNIYLKEKIVVPKATKVQGQSKQAKRPITTTMIMILNAKGRDDKNGSILERRRHIIQNVIQKYLPALILVQDFKFPDITSNFWSTNPIPNTYRYTGNEVVGVMFDHTLVDVQDIQNTEFQTTIEGLHRHANNGLKRTIPTDFNPFPRMCAKLITVKQGPRIHFICISWHGIFENKEGGKLKHAQKLEYFEYLMEFLRIVKEKVKLPIMIAGNFNVDMHSIEHLVQSPFQLCIYDASMRRTVPGIVDYYIITEELSLNEITWVSLRENTTAYQPNGVIDHDPVRAYITGKPGKGRGKGMTNPKWNPGRPN